MLGSRKDIMEADLNQNKALKTINGCLSIPSKTSEFAMLKPKRYPLVSKFPISEERVSIYPLSMTTCPANRVSGRSLSPLSWGKMWVKLCVLPQFVTGATHKQLLPHQQTELSISLLYSLELWW